MSSREDWIQALVRANFGNAFMPMSIADWSSTLVLFRETYKVPVLSPELAAYVGTFGELVFPILIVLGLAGRLGAAGLFVVNVMAVASYLELFGFECPAGINSHYYWGSMLLALVVFGPGKISLDEFILRRSRLKRGGAVVIPTSSAV